MRRKINYQQPEYVMNNELINFGLSSHETIELQPNWTPKAEKDLAIVSFMVNNGLKIVKKLVQERQTPRRSDPSRL
jgi:hypothetical protein